MGLRAAIYGDFDSGRRSRYITLAVSLSIHGNIERRILTFLAAFARAICFLHRIWACHCFCEYR